MLASRWVNSLILIVYFSMAGTNCGLCVCLRIPAPLETMLMIADMCVRIHVKFSLCRSSLTVSRSAGVDCSGVESRTGEQH